MIDGRAKAASDPGNQCVMIGSWRAGVLMRLVGVELHEGPIFIVNFEDKGLGGKI